MLTGARLCRYTPAMSDAELESLAPDPSGAADQSPLRSCRPQVRVATWLWPWCLRLAALLLPLSEGATEGALLAALVFALLAGRLRPRAARRGGLPAGLVTVGLSGWIFIGTAAAWLGGVAVRSSNLNKAVLSVGILLGVAVVTGVSAKDTGDYWTRIVRSEGRIVRLIARENCEARR